MLTPYPSLLPAIFFLVRSKVRNRFQKKIRNIEIITYKTNKNIKYNQSFII